MAEVFPHLVDTHPMDLHSIDNLDPPEVGHVRVIIVFFKPIKVYGKN